LSKIKVLIADDQDLFAAGIRIILQGYATDDIAVVGIAADGREAVRMTEAHRPDVVLMDVRMPLMDGVEATRVIHERLPDTKILILTTFDDDQYVFDALNNGALGYVLKNIQPDELVTSIKAVHRGNFLISPSVGYKLVKQAHEGIAAHARGSIEYHAEINFLLSHFETLRTREAEVLHLLLQDYDNREIGGHLGIAEQTVKNHVSVIYSKLGVDDRTHAKKLVKQVLARAQHARADESP